MLRSRVRSSQVKYPRFHSGGPFERFTASEIAYVVKGTYRVFLPEPGGLREIVLHIQLRHSCNTIRSDDRLHEGFAIMFDGAKPGPAIKMRRAAVENETLTLFCKNLVAVRKRFLRGDALLIEAASKNHVGIHLQLLVQEKEPVKP